MSAPSLDEFVRLNQQTLAWGLRFYSGTKEQEATKLRALQTQVKELSEKLGVVLSAIDTQLTAAEKESIAKQAEIERLLQ